MSRGAGAVTDVADLNAHRPHVGPESVTVSTAECCQSFPDTAPPLSRRCPEHERDNLKAILLAFPRAIDPMRPPRRGQPTRHTRTADAAAPDALRTLLSAEDGVRSRVAEARAEADRLIAEARDAAAKGLTMRDTQLAAAIARLESQRADRIKEERQRIEADAAAAVARYAAIDDARARNLAKSVVRRLIPTPSHPDRVR